MHKDFSATNNNPDLVNKEGLSMTPTFLRGRGIISRVGLFPGGLGAPGNQDMWIGPGDSFCLLGYGLFTHMTKWRLIPGMW